MMNSRVLVLVVWILLGVSCSVRELGETEKVSLDCTRLTQPELSTLFTQSNRENDLKDLITNEYQVDADQILWSRYDADETGAIWEQDGIAYSARIYDNHVTRVQALFLETQGATFSVKDVRTCLGAPAYYFLGPAIDPEGSNFLLLVFPETGKIADTTITETELFPSDSINLTIGRIEHTRPGTLEEVLESGLLGGSFLDLSSFTLWENSNP